MRLQAWFYEHKFWLSLESYSKKHAIEDQNYCDIKMVAMKKINLKRKRIPQPIGIKYVSIV
jgi:hypothetical protein